MWSKTFKPGDGKAKRDVAMSAQASLILKKKAEIEAKMAADGKGPEKKERKPISLSINKRWGLKGKKDGPGPSGTPKPQISTTCNITTASTSITDSNHWSKYISPSTHSQSSPQQTHTPTFMTDSGPGLPPHPQAPNNMHSQPHVAHQPHQITFNQQLSSQPPQYPQEYEQGRTQLHPHSQLNTYNAVQQVSSQPNPFLAQPPPSQPPPPSAPPQQLSYDVTRPPPVMQPAAPIHYQQQQPTHQPPMQYDSSAPPPQFLQNVPSVPSNTSNIPPQMLQSPNHPLQPSFPPNIGSHPHTIISQAPSVTSQQSSQSHSVTLQPPQIGTQIPVGPQYSSILSHQHPTAPYPPAHPEHQMVAPLQTAPSNSHQMQFSQTPLPQPPPAASQPPPILSQPPPLSSHPPPIGPTFSHHPPAHIPPQPPSIITHPPPGPPPASVSHPPPNISLPPPIDPFQGPPPSQPPLHIYGLPPASTDVSVPPPSTFPDISHPPPNTNFPPPIGSQPPPGMTNQQPPPVTHSPAMQPNVPPQGSGPSWWKDALAKAKDIASVIGKPSPQLSGSSPAIPPPGYQAIEKGHHAPGAVKERYERHLGGTDQRGDNRNLNEPRMSLEGGRGFWSENHNHDDPRDRDVRRRRGSGDDYGNREWRRSRSRDRGWERSPQRDRSPRRSRSRANSKDSDRSHFRERHLSGSSSLSAATTKDDRDSPGPSSKRERKFKEERESKVEPRDIDLRKPRQEGEREHPQTRPDYSSSMPIAVNSGEPLPSVVEELASMVAVSGEDLEDIARDRNQNTPELKFLFEKSGPLYKRYRARVAELKESFDDSKTKITEGETHRDEPTKKRKSRWGKQEPAENLPNIGTPNSVGAPGVAIPTTLGGLVQKLVTPTPKLTSIGTGNPALTAYAQRVFGTTDLTAAQWKQCEDQLKMSMVYGDLAAKKAMATAMSAAGKIKYEYDSDEDVEGGTWEHRARQAEMAKTEKEAAKMTEEAEGKHHIGDFLPPEELNKFMNKYKALRSGTAWDNSEYQENRLTQNNVGFKMLQKMGWAEGAGLGADGQGVVNPIGKSGAGVERMGLGSSKPGEVGEDDDEFDQYRKRMMLAYRFRPNPMNNPRRQYY